MPESLVDIELRSEEVEEVLSAPPAWLVRWGLSVIMLLILLLLVVSNLVQYPDVISGEVMLTTQNPPVKIVANSSGKLSKLLKSEGDSLFLGEVIAEIENPITSQGVEYLKSLVDHVDAFIDGSPELVNFSDSGYVFGVIQDEYNTLKKLYIDYYYWSNDTYQQREVKNISAKIEQYYRLISITEKQVKIALNELSNAQEKYQTDRLLYKEGVLAKLQFFQEESAFHQRKQEVENLNKATTQNRIVLLDLEKQLLDIKQQQAETQRNFRDEITLNLHAIRNHIDNWQKSYLVIAPISGRLSYLKPLSNSQFIQADEFIFAVIPEEKEYQGIVKIPSHGVGKVKVGQMVRLKFNNYPHEEYGQVNGIVEKISLLASDNTYRVKLQLPQGLTTSYNKQLPFAPEMIGLAEIVTEDLSIMERVFYNIRSIFS